MTKHSITVRYECDTCHRKTPAIPHNGERFRRFTGELICAVKNWFIYSDGMGNDKHECPTCHIKRIAKLPAHLR